MPEELRRILWIGLAVVVLGLCMLVAVWAGLMVLPWVVWWLGIGY